MKAPRRPLALAAALSLLAACGGGSKEPAASCTHEATSTTGPGDVDHHFPVEVGRTWTYVTSDEDGLGTRTVTVVAPGELAGEPVSVFEVTWVTTTFTSQRQSGTLVDRYAVRPGGVSLLARSSSEGDDPVLDQLLPRRVVPFPVQASTPVKQATCTNLRLPADGATVYADVVEYLSIQTVHPTYTIEPLGAFSNVAEVWTRLELTLRSGGQTVPGWIQNTSYYAPGVGLISMYTGMQLGPSDYSAAYRTLVAYSVPP
jgi:hypothetical protein